MKQQNNQLITSAYQFRKRKFLTLIVITIVFFLLTLSYFTPPIPSAQETASKHYSVITRTTEFVTEETPKNKENDYPTITVSETDAAITTELILPPPPPPSPPPSPSPSPEKSTVSFPGCTKDLSRNSNIFPNHYNVVLIISSRIEDFNQRKLLRKLLFNINDNLIPCMHQDNDKQPFHNIYYQFLVKNIKSDENIKNTKNTKNKNTSAEEVKRNFIAEKMEFNDLTDITSDDGDDWQTSMLKWSQNLNEESCISYDFLVIQDSLTLPNLIKLQKVLYSKSSLIGNNKIKDKQNLIWGSFGTNLTDNMFTVLGSNVIPKVLKDPLIKESTTNYTNIVSRFVRNKIENNNYSNFVNINNNDIIIFNDNSTIIEWPNSIYSISSSIDNVIAIGNIYQDWIMTDLSSSLQIEQIIPCKSRMDLKKSSTILNHYKNVDLDKSYRQSVVITTSSYLYADNCMNIAAALSADNKRVYANKHGYAFVARSKEYWQQTFRVRHKVWGKLDFVETILPYYEWLVWLDMDAIFVNRTFSIEKLFESIKERMVKSNDKRDFNDINFIVARPSGDDMINAGVFLMRNTHWSFRFLRAVQGRIDRAFRGMKEQQALRDAIAKPEWSSQIYYIDEEDHVINTFPDRYLPGDFILHYAPEEGCPAIPVMNGLQKLENLETVEGYKVELPF